MASADLRAPHTHPTRQKGRPEAGQEALLGEGFLVPCYVAAGGRRKQSREAPSRETPCSLIKGQRRTEITGQEGQTRLPNSAVTDSLQIR